MHSSFWLAPSSLTWMFSYPLEIMNSQTTRTSGTHLKGFSSFITSLFLMIIMINFMGLLPYTFSFSSHLIFTLSLGLPLWLSLIISSAIYNPKTFTASLLPGGAPDWLNPFLVMIETISIMVRPITLSVRLAANMSAGHIVLGLIGIYASSAMFLSFTSTATLISIQILYTIFEMGICLIQAYIFCLLITLYADDHS
uniref:ATP synthase subunit a n=1 Tax=Glycera americana TaxID=37469 RepID=A0A0U2X2D7_9ANNE|nr:ATP synthase F0 subunit 6 [Glycera americana]